MAQISIQYALHQQLDIHEEKMIKRALDQFPGVKSVSVNMESGILCIDYDDTGVKRDELEQRMSELGYSISMIDAISF